ncbi:hypothetical protein OIO90_001573 [Microbotryomycetes sp. JL221]|nr:hypothetical protein OIO90_001573 [Microbotryomycetes sp. JL221]
MTSVSESRLASSFVPRGALQGLSGQLVQAHVQELNRIDDVNTWQKVWQQPWARLLNLWYIIALVLWILESLQRFVVRLLLAPISIFGDPLSTIASLVIYPVVFGVITISGIFFWIASLFGGAGFIEWLGVTFANGYGMANWPDPDLLKSEETTLTMQRARATFAGERPTTYSSTPGPLDADLSPERTTRVFDIDAAKALIALSALVYERVDSDMLLAADAARQKDFAVAVNWVWAAERKIRERANVWGLEFEGISDLSTNNGGQFVGLFHTEAGAPRPFMVLAAKGTTPTNFANFLTDATISKVSAAPFFGQGNCHQGFYTSLFPTPGNSTDGYSQIVATVKLVAAKLRNSDGERIPLWITGHSLGSALSSLLFHRFLKMPSDLGDDVELRDCYGFGTPRQGDFDYCESFNTAIVTPFNRHNILWRVRNNLDIVARVPPGLGDKASFGSYLSKLSVLNYGHFGAALNLRPFFKPYFNTSSQSFIGTTDIVIRREPVEQEQQDDLRVVRGDRKHWKSFRRYVVTHSNAGWPLNPVVLATALLPSFIFDHMPAAYYYNLDRIEVEAK